MYDGLEIVTLFAVNRALSSWSVSSHLSTNGSSPVSLIGGSSFLVVSLSSGSFLSSSDGDLPLYDFDPPSSMVLPLPS